MNYMMKLIFMAVAMIALIGPSVAANVVGTSLAINGCELTEDNLLDYLIAGTTIASIGTPTNTQVAEIIDVDYETGDVLVLPIGYGSVTFPYSVLYPNGNIVPKLYTIRVFSLSCGECSCEPNDPGDNIQIGTPVVGETVPVSWSAPGGNGNWALGLYEDGVLNRGAWTGLYPIEVIAQELDEDNIPTGFEISDCICG